MGVEEDMNTEGIQCNNHPFRSTSPGGGICAFCLQDKLGKLVSSSSSSFFITSSSSSSTTTPSFRSDLHHPSQPPPPPPPPPPPSSSSNTHFHKTNHIHRRARIPFLLTHNKKNKTKSPSPSSPSPSMLLKRSKSTAHRPSSSSSSRFLSDDFTPRPRGFWSFLHLSNPSTSHNNNNKKHTTGSSSSNNNSSKQVEVTAVQTQTQTPATSSVVIDETDDSPNSTSSNTNTTSFGRQVSRSRSVGCGSRSFSGDFFERISTGFGDCTLRRVESQREGATKHRHSTSRAAGDTIREKVRCGGLFGAFIITSSSSSTSSNSSYWTGNGRPNGPSSTPGNGPLIHSRTRSWGWAFARPNTTTTTTIKDGKRELGDGNGKNSIPSLLDVRG